MKRTSLAVAAVLVLVPSGFAAVSCADEKKSAPGAPVAVTSAPAPERLTPQLAARVFGTYITNDDVARASGAERLALTWAADGQSDLIAAEYRRAAFSGDPVPRYVYGAPSLYVPKLTDLSYPQWFVASADRDPVPAEAGAKPDPKARRTALLAFFRKSPAEPWKLSLATVLQPKAKLPKIALDAEGYATPLATGDTTVLIPPKSVPGIHSAVAEEGPDTVPAKLMKPGPATTGYYAQTRKVVKAAKTAGLAYEPIFTATQFPIFPLRTADGGGLVLYALGRDSVTIARNKKAKLTVPREAAHLLTSLLISDQLHVTQTLQFAVSDPAKANGKKPQAKADVIAIDGAVTKATAPEKQVP